MKLAAIDVGSNAVRLLLSRVIDEGDYAANPVLKKESLVRLPIRLGDEVFAEQRISRPQADRLVEAMIGFRHLIKAYEALDYAACATSAMREASNGSEVVEEIKRASGIDLSIVDGHREAEIIVSNSEDFQTRDKHRSYLHIDVGGGSTEMSVLYDGQTIDSRSFDIGTLRILRGQVKEERWKEMRRWLKSIRLNRSSMAGIGSGGNINKIFRLSRRKEGQPLSLKQLTHIHATLAALSIDERIRIIGLRPDRADVIVPAAEIFLSAMTWADFKQLYVPQVGLADGLIRILYKNKCELREGGKNAGKPWESC